MHAHKLWPCFYGFCDSAHKLCLLPQLWPCLPTPSACLKTTTWRQLIPAYPQVTHRPNLCDVTTSKGRTLSSLFSRGLSMEMRGNESLKRGGIYFFLPKEIHFFVCPGYCNVLSASTDVVDFTFFSAISVLLSLLIYWLTNFCSWDHLQVISRASFGQMLLFPNGDVCCRSGVLGPRLCTCRVPRDLHAHPELQELHRRLHQGRLLLPHAVERKLPQGVASSSN